MSRTSASPASEPPSQSGKPPAAAPRTSGWRTLRKTAQTPLVLLLGVAVFVVVLLLYVQRKMIFHPRRYHQSELETLPPQTLTLTFETRDGEQVAYYLAPRGKPPGPPRRLWVFFGGNASLALDWRHFLERARRPDAGYLLIDYPGYGQCAGSPSRKGINAGGEAALRELAKQLGVAPTALEGDLNVLGQSLGTAAALDFAVRHPVRRAILISPLTGVEEMAREMVGWPLCLLVLDRFDNRARLAELGARPAPPAVTVFHGDRDRVLSVDMGRALARQFPKLVDYHEIAGAGHNDLIPQITADLTNAMNK